MANKIVVRLDGGLVQDVFVEDVQGARIPFTGTLEVRDYDTEDLEQDDLEQDSDGDWYYMTTWGG